LKLAEDFIKDLNALSPPMRGRGLKRITTLRTAIRRSRPPCGGVD